FCGGAIGLVTTFILFSKHLRSQHLTMEDFKTGVIEGAKSMLPAFSILIFAWAITFLIGELCTGNYLAGVVESSEVSLSLLPVIVCVIAAFIDFSTGTSCGSFAILLPIAGHFAVYTDPSL